MLKPTLIIEVPTELFVEFLDRSLKLDGSLPHNSMDLLSLFEALHRCVLKLWLDAFLSKVDAHLFLVHSEDFHHFLLANLKEFVD